MGVREPIQRLTHPDGMTRGYRVTVDVGADPATGQRRQRRSTHRTVKEARAWLAATRVAVDRGTFLERHRTTLSQHLDGWLTGRLNLRPSTRDGYRIALAPWHDQLGAVPLAALTRRQVEDVRDRMLTGELRTGKVRRGEEPRPLSARTVRLALGTLQMALDAAVRDEVLSRNIVRHVERPSGAAAPGAAWSADEARRFLAVAATDRLDAAWRLSVVGGLRRGEVCGLRWTSIDLTAATLAITEARVTVRGETLVSKPKTARGARVLPLPAQLIDALRRHHARQAAERLAAGEAYQDSGYVVTDELGAPLRPEVYSDRFARLARAAGVPAIRLHDARHTSVTLKRADGWPDAVTAAWHGHDEAIMRRVYTHVTVEDMRQHAQRL